MEKKTNGIPMFITESNKVLLRSMGCNETHLKYMRPDEAIRIINGELSIDQYSIDKAIEIVEEDFRRWKEWYEQDKKRKEILEKLKSGLTDDFVITGN